MILFQSSFLFLIYICEALTEKYLLLLNLALLGFDSFLSLFEVAIGKVILFENLDKANHFEFYIGNLVDNSKNFSLEKSKEISSYEKKLEKNKPWIN